MDIVDKLNRIIERARTGMPPVGIETLQEAVREIERLREDWVKAPRNEIIIEP